MKVIIWNPITIFITVHLVQGKDFLCSYYHKNNDKQSLSYTRMHT